MIYRIALSVLGGSESVGQHGSCSELICCCGDGEKMKIKDIEFN